MANAIAIIKMAPTTLSSYFSSFKTLLRNPLPTPKVFVIKYLKQLVSKIIKVKLLTSARKSENFKPVALRDNKLEDIVAKALRLEFKMVNKLSLIVF
jgi:hypothetical protein